MIASKRDARARNLKIYGDSVKECSNRIFLWIHCHVYLDKALTADHCIGMIRVWFFDSSPEDFLLKRESNLAQSQFAIHSEHRFFRLPSRVGLNIITSASSSESSKSPAVGISSNVEEFVGLWKS